MFKEKKLAFFSLILPLLASLSGAQAVAVEENVCASSNVTLSADFPLGAMASCEVKANNAFTVFISPEDKPINPSPWYAFRVSEHDAKVTVKIHYTHSKHRYWPKISFDAQNWSRLDEKYFTKLEDNLVEIALPANDRPVFIAAQELVSNGSYEVWGDALALKPGITKSWIGNSVEGRDIFKLESLQSKVTSKNQPYVFLVGRQHPPEVTGALAMKPFIETILADTELATKFRDTFNLIMVPNLNPDGVNDGHWRHNKRGKDLNRDWGPFEHVETQLMKSELDAFNDADNQTGKSLWFFLDFHSTARNLLYTQLDKDELFMKGFTHNWLTSTEKRAKKYTFTREGRENSDLPTSKNYVYTRFGIPAITYEVGDETDRGAIVEGAVIFAEEMMKELLARYKTEIKAPHDE
ncbi:M14 family metallopeptidase [Kordiimonas sp. SCSIO 12610]|uniref:M14 family metallopeptidase n=1 Tax=Kordiimonas sp. SCSIO 12610 TaxID=2829597 RepID=UPI002108855F|nr:M14 family metallopeptidase [Kordiimonas sp. SCSIO 12610]UTW53979.1 succinylglutamate desuccinylase/aspartoacylase family protein [Kordiimonas sp. SCSIO 12610]